MMGPRIGVRWLPRPLVAAIAVIATAAAVTGCTVSPANMDLSNPLVTRDQYDVRMKFADVLNLPIGSRVAFGGMNIGRVSAVGLGDDAATVTARIDRGTRVPAAVHASVVQDTLLGEAYVRLELPESGAGGADLTSGATLPLTQTSAPRSVETTLSVLANYFGSGSVEELSRTIAKLNTSMPKDGKELRQVTAQVGRDATGIAANTAEFNRLLDSAVRTSATLQRHNPDFVFTLSPYHMRYWKNQGKLMSNIGVLLPAVGSMFQQGYWLIPLMDSSSDLFELMTADMVSIGDAIHGGSVLVNKGLVPFLSKPVIAVQNVTGPNGQDLKPGAVSVLRLLGQAR